MEAKTLLMRCGVHGKLFGVRVEKRYGEWVRVDTSKLNEDAMNVSAYEKDMAFIHGKFGYANGYTGCPYCGAKDFLTCNRPGCKKLTCINWGTKTGQCQWDGHRMFNLVWRPEDMETTGKPSQ